MAARPGRTDGRRTVGPARRDAGMDVYEGPDGIFVQ